MPMTSMSQPFYHPISDSSSWKACQTNTRAFNTDAVQFHQTLSIIHEVTRNDARSIPPALITVLVERTFHADPTVAKDVSEWLLRKLEARQHCGLIFVVVKVNKILHYLLLRGSAAFVEVMHTKGQQLLDVRHVQTCVQHTEQHLLASGDGSSPTSATVGLIDHADTTLERELASALGHMVYLQSLLQFRVDHPHLSLQDPQVDSSWPLPDLKLLAQSSMELLKALATTSSRNPKEWSLMVGATQRRAEDIHKWYTLAVRLLFAILFKLLPCAGDPIGHVSKAELPLVYLSSTNPEDAPILGTVRGPPSSTMSDPGTRSFLREWYHLLYQYNRTIKTILEHVRELSADADPSMLRVWGLSKLQLELIPASQLSHLCDAAQRWCRDSQATTPISSCRASSFASQASQQRVTRVACPSSDSIVSPSEREWITVWAGQLDLLAVIFRGDDRLASMVEQARAERQRLGKCIDPYDGVDAMPLSAPSSDAQPVTPLAGTSNHLNAQLATRGASSLTSPMPLIIPTVSGGMVNGNPLKDTGSGTAGLHHPPLHLDPTPPPTPPPPASTTISKAMSQTPPHTSGGSSVDGGAPVPQRSEASSGVVSYQFNMISEAEVRRLLETEEAIVVCQDAHATDGDLRLVDRFVLQTEECIGTGDNGRVYRAWDEGAGCHLAAKEFLLDGDDDERVRNSVLEYTLLTELQHHNVIRVVALTVTRTKARIFMEWMPSGSLLDVLGTNGTGRLGENLIRRYARDCLMGLAFLHAHGVLHRDVKPSNMLLSAEGSVKLTDFGMCSRLRGSQSTLQTNIVSGTVPYMAPESVRGTYSPATDIWALGCALLEMFSGLPPWADPKTGTVPEPVALLFRIGGLSEEEGEESLPHAYLLSDATRPDGVAPPSEAFVDFLTSIFVVDRKKRAEAEELLQHSFLN